jgi:chromosome segregation ATPase
MMYALPCLASAAVLYAANRLAAGEKVKELEEELAECKEKYEHLECHHEELMADERAVRKELEQTKLELNQVRSASRDIIDETMKEIEHVYAWIKANGYGIEELQNGLQQEFHGQVPSEIYRRKQNEQKMQAALASGE